MRRMKDNQRKAMFAKMSMRNQQYLRKHPSAYNYSFSQLKKKGHYMRYQADNDHDGVKNVKDCQPLNPDKQGYIHDVKMKLLKRREEAIEKKREKQQKKLEDIKDELKAKRSVFSKEQSLRQAELSEKQAVLNEIKAEQKKLDDMKAAEKAAKKEMDKYTFTGKIKRGASAAWRKSEEAGAKTRKWWDSPEQRAKRKKAGKASYKALRKIYKQL